jgi:hypothetical protein
VCVCVCVCVRARVRGREGSAKLVGKEVEGGGGGWVSIEFE